MTIDVPDIFIEVFEESADSFDDEILDGEILAFWSTMNKISWFTGVNVILFRIFSIIVKLVDLLHFWHSWVSNAKNTINQALS